MVKHIAVLVNAPTGQLAMSLVARQLVRDGRVGYHVTGFVEAEENLANDLVAVYVVVPPVTTFVVTVEREVEDLGVNIHFHADSGDLPWPGGLDADCHHGTGLIVPPAEREVEDLWIDLGGEG